MIAKMKSLVTLAAGALLAATVSTAAMADQPAYVRIRGVNYAGSGCPAGSVAQNLSSDYRALTLLFDSFIAEVGPGVPFSQKRKNCQINVDLEFPNGWSYSLVTVDYRGYVSLEAGVTANQSSSYYFSGQSRTGRLQSNFAGPRSQDYQVRDTLGVEALVWSPCGAARALNINAAVAADNARAPSRRGVITLDSTDLEVKHIYGLQWQRCR